ncbi:hypothetical protein METBIDRAFT_31865, partial [Metschnikowia bicuspidata var. bicuspidata NRRL YB-4993]
MSFTATATREVAPTINLSDFSHPPTTQIHAEDAGAETRLMPLAPPAKPGAAQAQFSDDDDDEFNLDMVTMDMNFEQAYSMYTQLQQKNALLEVEHLQKAQQLNHKQAHEQIRLFLDEVLLSQQAPRPAGADKQWARAAELYPGDYSSQCHARFYPETLLDQTGGPSRNMAHTVEAVQHAACHAALPDISGAPLISPPGEMVEGFVEMFAGQQAEQTTVGDGFPAMNEEEEADQFFSTTESSALERFLDNLASSSEINPLEFYHPNPPKLPHMFEMRTMGQQEHFGAPANAKPEPAAGFQMHPSQDLGGFGGGAKPAQQLQTPDTSVGQVQTKRVRDAPDASEPSANKRKLAKPLLSSTQKRLNHSHLEQKRRRLCKEAYDRCLRLVTNVDDYKNELIHVSADKGSKKKSRRRQLTKDGLPNLSKHAALQKISSEISKIQSKNEELRR